MLDFADAPRRDFTCQGIILSAPLPYEEGHELTKNESAVMNQTWVENLRNNFAAKLQKLCKEHKVEDAEKLPEDIKKTVQKTFDDYAEGYEFGVRGVSTVDPVRAQAVQLAIAKVKEALKKKGHKLSEIGADKIKEMAEDAVDKRPAFMERAEKLIAAKRAAAEELSVDL